MITQSNLISATNKLNNHSLAGLEDILKALHAVLNILAPDATIEYTFSKLGGSTNTPETIDVSMAVKYDNNPKSISFTLCMKYDEDTPWLMLHIDDSQFYVASKQQILGVAKCIHKTFIHQHNVFDQSITIGDLTVYQKQMVTDFIRKHNLTNT